MNLHEVWRKLEVEKLEVDHPSPLNPWAAKSKHPIAKLKSAYKMTALFSLVFLILCVVLFFLIDQWVVQVGLLATNVSFLFGFVTNFSMFRKIDRGLPMDGNVRMALQNTYDYIRSNIRFQERTALFFYPLSGSAGFMVGTAITGADVWALLQLPAVYWSLLAFAVIITPVGWLSTRWMYKVSYGVCLAQLRDLIAELDQPVEE